MIANSETQTRPIYTAEFKDLDPTRLRPAGTRYQPREEPSIGMFETGRAQQARKGTSNLVGKDKRAQAQATLKAGNRTIRPHSIATRCIEAMRERGDWIGTVELIELANQHRPDGCVVATRRNIHEALAEWRKRGVIESKPIGQGAQEVVWRIAA